MGHSLLITAYLAVATFVTVWTFYWGVLNRPAHRYFAMGEYAILTLTCIVVGLAWVLFIPSLIVLAARQVALRVENARRDSLFSREVRAKA